MHKHFARSFTKNMENKRREEVHGTIKMVHADEETVFAFEIE